MSDLYDKLYEDLKACALAAIPVDPMDGTTFLQFEGRTCIWGSPDIVAAAVASATYTVVGIRLDDARAEGVAAGRKQAADALTAKLSQIHFPIGELIANSTETFWCNCDAVYPCPTIKALAEGGEPNAG